MGGQKKETLDSSSSMTGGSSWNPYGPQGQAFNNMFQYAGDQFRNQQQYYPGSTVGPQSGLTQMAQQGGQELYNRGPSSPQAGGYVNDLLAGKYLSPQSNPYLQQMADQGAADVTRQFKQAAFPATSLGSYGRAGSGSEMNRESVAYRGLGDALASNYSNTFGAHYAQERGMQQQGIGMQFAMDEARRNDIYGAAQLGGQQDAYNQRMRDDEVARFNFGQQEPGRRTDDYIRRIMGAGVLQGETSMWQEQEGMQQAISGSDFTTGQAVGAGTSLIGAGMMASSRSVKHEIDEVDPVQCVRRLEALPIAIWKYKEEFNPDDQAAHMGPYAEDFQKLLGLGDGKAISFIDVIGFALAATQGVTMLVNELTKRVEELEPSSLDLVEQGA